MVINKMRMILLFTIALSFIAQSQHQITNVANRNTISLNGEWSIIIDPYENGFYNYRYEENPNGYFKNAKPKSKSDLVEYDFDKSEKLNVPGDWNTQRNDLFFYEGTVWYKKSFDYNTKPHSRLFIYFGAVNYNAIVYVNGEKIGTHTGGFTAFNFDITSKVKSGSNFVVVKVDNKRTRDGVPTLNTDWWNYGGITRDVNLVEVPEEFIDDYFIQLDPKKANTITGWIKLSGLTTSQEVKIKIPEADIEKTFVTDNTGHCSFTFNAQLDYWLPESPKLYDVIIETDKNKIVDQIGFRKIEVDGTDIKLMCVCVCAMVVCITISVYASGVMVAVAAAVVCGCWSRVAR